MIFNHPEIYSQTSLACRCGIFSALSIRNGIRTSSGFNLFLYLQPHLLYHNFYPPLLISFLISSWVGSTETPKSNSSTTKYLTSPVPKFRISPPYYVPPIPQYSSGEHEAKFSHELLGGAAAFYAARKYEEHVAENGPPPTHALAKELL